MSICSAGRMVRLGALLFVLGHPVCDQPTDPDAGLEVESESDSISVDSRSPDSLTVNTAATKPMEDSVAALIPRSVLWRSALLPGWGQWRSGHRFKAVAFGAASMGWLTAVALEHERISQAPTPTLYQERVGRRNTQVLWYVITATAAAIDAYVDVHLDNFDVDEGFSLDVNPGMRTRAASGATLILRF